MSTETTVPDAGSTTTGAVTVRFYAGAAEAAGAEERKLPLSEGQGLDEFLSRLPELIAAPSLERVCSRSSFLVNGVRTKRETGALSPGDQLDVLPPFAGG